MFTSVIMPFTFKENPDPESVYEKQADPTLGARLVSEENLSGILNLIIARAPMIVKKRKICRRENDFERYEEQSHSFTHFVEQFIEIRPELRESLDWQLFSKDVYGKFCEYTESSTGSELTKDNFARKMNRAIGQKSTTIRKGLLVGKGFKGIRFDDSAFKFYQDGRLLELYNSKSSVTTCNEFVTGNTDTVTGVTGVTGYRFIIGKVEEYIKCIREKKSLFHQPVTKSQNEPLHSDV